MAAAAFIISVLALGVAAWALLYSHRQAVAAERSADADERAVALAEAQAERYAPPWALQWENGDAYVLTNESDEAAHDVRIDLADLQLLRGELEHAQIGPRSGMKLIVVRTWGTDDTATVTWSRTPGGPRLEWSHPFPRKPR
ncbi:hypothetical protein [Xylanimonas protaetiae]|uniref:Uncharacterized protein n=1 Tax=Xylanimonas protaetiae TaxID=2509457 RepID=A0A4P6F344_9MICO|nr:hypothetical protein [Xylanimonas protaetiae]QAY70002.1 hypothetical protein ET471_08130 [Xylanimonas protaetiae]